MYLIIILLYVLLAVLVAFFIAKWRSNRIFQEIEGKNKISQKQFSINENLPMRQTANGKENIKLKKDKNYSEGTQIPLGLGMALAQNIDAMNRFAALGEKEKQEIINHTHEIHSKQEMRAYVESVFFK